MKSENSKPQGNPVDSQGAGKDESNDGSGQHEPMLGELGAQASEERKARKADGLKKPKKTVSLGITVAVAVVVALVCGVGGYAVSGPINDSMHPGSAATLTDADLDRVIASYSFDGTGANITAREVITGMGSAANSDGNYSAPSASTITNYVQNKVMSDEADKRGLTASDDEIKAYAESSMGSSDYDSIGQQYSLSGDQVKQMMAQSVKTNKLVNDVVGFDTTSPTEPTDPGKKKRGPKTAEFGSYVVDLLQKAGVWDSSTGTWSGTDNDYYTELGDGFDGKSASYSQAKKVYDIYNTSYQSRLGQASSAWQSFTNELYAKIDLSLYGVYSS